VLDDGTTRVAIVTTDLVGTNAEMKRRVAERTGIAPERLLLCASHTHSGPGAYGKGIFATAVLGAYDQKFFDFLTDRITASVQAALGKRVPARFGAGAAELPGYGRNRRKGNTLTDPQLTVVRIDTADGKPLAALVNYTAHGTVLDADNMLASADWMGVAQALIEKDVPGVTAFYANGAEGDQSPAGYDDRHGFERAQMIGEAVARAALDVYRKIEPRDSLRITTVAEDMTLPESASGLLIGAGKTTFIQAIGLNDVLLISIPGELIAELGLRLKAHAKEKGWKIPVIMGLANDHLGYFLTEAEFRKGGYEATVSFFGPKFGEQLTADVEALIDRISMHRKGAEKMRKETN